MYPRHQSRAHSLTTIIRRYESNSGDLPGLRSPEHISVLVYQIIDSLRRVEYAQFLRDGQHDPLRADPTSDLFDPLRAAVLCSRRGALDEAWWLVFLATHFGKHSSDGWRLTRDVYGSLGQGTVWDWSTVSTNPVAFSSWVALNEEQLRGGDGVSRRFSNHRKYESLKAASAKGTTHIVSSYVAWIAPYQTHSKLIRDVHRQVGQEPGSVFEALYKSMNAVHRFGRLAKFDFLAMLGKLGIAPIEPQSTFLKGATGPLAGARLLFGGARNANLKAADLEESLKDFGRQTGLGSQVLEDSLCNWQKNPSQYKLFRG